MCRLTCWPPLNPRQAAISTGVGMGSGQSNGRGVGVAAKAESTRRSGRVKRRLVLPGRSACGTHHLEGDDDTKAGAMPAVLGYGPTGDGPLESALGKGKAQSYGKERPQQQQQATGPAEADDNENSSGTPHPRVISSPGCDHTPRYSASRGY